jgi:hypothetical protein
MNRATRFRAGFRLLVAGSMLALATPSSAADAGIPAPFTPFQLAIFPGWWQVFSEPTAVYGVRVSAVYGIQSKVWGLDTGLFNETESMIGIGTGISNIVRENGMGIQLAAFNSVEADFTGLQTSLANVVGGQIMGLQVGFVNIAEAGTGLQIGFLNRSDSIRGVQFGLLNWNKNGFLPFFPFVNFGF